MLITCKKSFFDVKTELAVFGQPTIKGRWGLFVPSGPPPDLSLSLSRRHTQWTKVVTFIAPKYRILPFTKLWPISILRQNKNYTIFIKIEKGALIFRCHDFFWWAAFPSYFHMTHVCWLEYGLVEKIAPSWENCFYDKSKIMSIFASIRGQIFSYTSTLRLIDF